MDNVDGRYFKIKIDILKKFKIFLLKLYKMSKQLILFNLNHFNNKNNSIWELCMNSIVWNYHIYYMDYDSNIILYKRK